MTHASPAMARFDEELVDELLLAAEQATDDTTRRRCREQVITRTVPVADALARRYRGRGVDLEDLEQVARAALVAAVGRYRREAGPGFLAFVVPTVTGELKRYFRDCGWTVRPPRRLQELRAAVAAGSDHLRQRLGREPSALEVAAWLGVDVGSVGEAKACGSGFSPSSLDDHTPRGGTVGDRLPDATDAHTACETRLVLRELVAQLDDRDRSILAMRYVEELTQTQIGAAIGVSQMQVSRLLNRIHARLRQGLVAA